MVKVDKRNGKVGFLTENHEYFEIEHPDRKYISVTTLIDRYVQPFDKDFWSAYKALEKMLPEDKWALEKKCLLSTKKYDRKVLKIYKLDEGLFETERKRILDEWDRKNREACERGTKIHKDIEQSFYDNPHGISMKKFGIGGKFECRKDYSALDMEYGVYPEYLVYYDSEDGKLRLAGQIDLIIKSGNEITVVDNKSNAEIRMKSGYDPYHNGQVMMKYPLNNLQDCNFYHYSMQLSTYAWMLQKINKDFVIRSLILNHYDHKGKNTLYHCQYLKDEVERMLSHYKKGLLLDERRSRRKPVDY